MASRDVKIRVSAEIGAFKRDMAQVAASAKTAGTAAQTSGTAAASGIGRLSQVANKHEQAWKQTSTAMVVGGAAIVGGLGMAAKAAMDWESAWTGVKKTVEGTPEQLGAVEDGLRHLARTLPSTHTEIAAVAQAAGQLGVATPDIVSFTKTMIDLGESTNLSAEEAATGLARFANVMGTSNKDVNKLGAALVGLGNNFATTESEILTMAQRLSGAAAQTSLSEGETLGLAAAMSSLGINAEAGGSSMSKIMQKIGKAVDSGSEDMEKFAKVAGMSGDEFQKMWNQDTAGALDAVVQGLGQAGEAGESVNGILTDLGITQLREVDAMLRLSSAGELMGEGMKKGADEYTVGMALIEEAAKRYETTESKIKASLSSLQDAAIDMGAVMLPAIAGIADGAAALATGFSKIPGPVKGALTGIAGITGVSLLAAGGMMKLVSSGLETVSGMRALAKEFPKAATGLKKVGKAAAIATAALIGMQVVGAIFSREHTKSAEDYAQAIVRVAQAGEQASNSDLDSLFTDWDTFMGGSRVKGVEDLASAVGELANPSFGDGLNKNLNFVNGFLNMPDDKLTQIEGRLRDMGSALGELATSGQAEAAAESFSLVAKSFEDAGGSAQQALDYMPDYADTLKKQATAAGVAVEPNELLKWAMTGVAPAAVEAAEGAERAKSGMEGLGEAGADAAAGAEEAAASAEQVAKDLEAVGLGADGAIESLSAYTEALFASGLAVMSSKEASFAWSKTMRDLKADIKEVTDSQAELGPVLNKGMTDFNKSTDSGDAALKLFNETVREGLGVAQTFAEDSTKSQAEVQNQLTSTYDAAVKTAEGFGVGKEAAEAMAREALQIPPDVSVKTWVEDEATRKFQEISGLIDKIPDMKGVKVIVTENGTVKVTADQIQGIKDRTVAAEVTDNGTILTVQGGIDNIEGTTEQVYVTDDGTVHTVQTRIDSVTGKTEYVYVDDNGTVHTVQGQIDGVKDGSAEVHVTASGINAVQNAIDSVTGKSVKIGVTTTRKEIIQRQVAPLHNPGAFFGALGHEHGGQLPRNAAGSRLPTTGPGTDTVDGILGAKRDGTPVSWLDGGEWVINNGSSDAYNGVLKMINDDDPRVRGLKGLAAGGRAGLGGLAKGGKAKAAAAAKKAAKEAADRAKEVRERAAERRKEAAELRHRKYVDRRDYQQDARRGNIGGDMSTVDKLFGLARNGDYSKQARKSAGRMAGTMEKHIIRLNKQSDALADSLETATKRRDELLSVKEGVASGLRGEFSLSGVLDSARKDLGAGMSVHSITHSANTKAKRIENFAGRLNRLRKMGYSESIIQEVAGLGVDDGIQVAGALISATGSERYALNKAYRRLDTASDRAGEYVTRSMFEGGLNAADGLVRGVEKKQAGVERAFYNLGKRAEGAFKRSLGIKSPSKVMEAAGINVGEGAELGVLSKVSDVQKAMGQLGATPGMGSWGTPSVPPSREVAAHAAANNGQAMAASVGAAVHEAMSAYQPMVNIGGRQFVGVMREAERQATRK